MQSHIRSCSFLKKKKKQWSVLSASVTILTVALYLNTNMASYPGTLGLISLLQLRVCVCELYSLCTRCSLASCVCAV